MNLFPCFPQNLFELVPLSYTYNHAGATPKSRRKRATRPHIVKITLGSKSTGVSSGQNRFVVVFFYCLSVALWHPVCRWNETSSVIIFKNIVIVGKMYYMFSIVTSISQEDISLQKVASWETPWLFFYYRIHPFLL